MFTVMFLDHRTPSVPARAVGTHYATEQDARVAATNMARGAAFGVDGLQHTFSSRAAVSVKGSTVLEFIVVEGEQ